MLVLQFLDKSIARLERWFIIGCAGVISTILVAQVLLRYVFSHPLFWAEEISTQILVYMTFFGLSLLVQKRRLIRLDFVVQILPSWARRTITFFSDVMVIGVLVVFVIYSINWLLMPETRLEMSATTGLPLWYTYAALPVAFMMMTFHYLVAALDVAFGTEMDGSVS